MLPGTFRKNLDFSSVSMYDSEENNASNGGVHLTAKDVVIAACRAVGCTQSEAAEKIGLNSALLYQRFIRNSLRADDLFRMLDAIGIDIQMTVRKNGRKVYVGNSSYGRRVRAMDDHVWYDTGRSDALANSFWSDGEHEYGADGKASELYVDSEGRYFLAMYSNIEGEKDKVQGVTADVAAAYIEKYGVILDKRPKQE